MRIVRNCKPLKRLIFVVRSIISGLSLCGLLALGWYSVLLARADILFRGDSLTTLRAATALAPSNADYHALLAEHLEVAGLNPDTELEIAAGLSPRESRYWIRLAFRAELEQKYDDCERYLLQAYRVDRGFDPRWALMNYYFRRGMLPQFWKFARQTLDMSYGSLDPVFRLCLAADTDPSATRRILPPRREILFAFFTYLVRHQQIASASAVAEELAPAARPDEVAGLIDYCDLQMGHDNRSCLTVWNDLCRRRLVPFSELAPERGEIVTDGDFPAPPVQLGFDWIYGAANGVSVGPIDGAQGISADISGEQSDSATIMEQEIPLSPGKQYSLNYEYRLTDALPASERHDIRSGSGLQWEIRGGFPGAGGGAPIAVSPVLSATDWNDGRMTFSAGQRDAAKLILQYRRALGTVRWKGAVQIRRVTSGIVPGLIQ